MKALLAGACLAALAAPAVGQGGPRESLRSSAAAVHESAQEAASLSLEAAKAELIASGITRAEVRASSAVLAAAELTAACDAPLREMAAAVDGGSGQESLRSQLDQARADLAPARQRLEKLRGAAEEAGRKIEAVPAKLPDGKPNPKRKKLDELRRRLLEALDAAVQADRRALDLGDQFSRLCDQAQAGRRRAAESQAAMALARGALAATAAELSPAAASAKAAARSLAPETDGPQRTRIWRQIEPVRVLAARLKGQAEALLSRDDDFSLAAAAFARARRESAGLKASLSDAAAQMKGPLDLAQGLLDKIAAQLDCGTSCPKED